MKLEIDSAKLAGEIDELASITAAEPPVVTRVVFTDADMHARAWLADRCRAAGLEIRRDPIGNTFVRWPGSDSKAPVVGTGSHIDAIPNAGKFDGTVGVLGGLEAIRTLKRAGFQPKNPIELLVLTSEEPTRFGVGCLGSRLLAGTMTSDAARKLVDKAGDSVDQVRRAAGFTGELEDVRLPKGYYKAWVELHIEQGPILEEKEIPLGIVTRISAPAGGFITIEGTGGHAGGVLMADRHDALCAASELILAIEAAAKATGSEDSVGTVGICEVFPGAVNSIPIRVRISFDIRDTNQARRDGVMRAMDEAAKSISKRRGVKVETQLLNADVPADCASEIIDALTAACRARGQKYLTMPSRAYHDSLFIANIAPVGMLFIPCRKGYSHRPDEYASIEHISLGTQILAETLANLSAS
jgi:ureidoglycolate amidohydrolase